MKINYHNVLINKVFTKINYTYHVYKNVGDVMRMIFCAFCSSHSTTSGTLVHFILLVELSKQTQTRGLTRATTSLSRAEPKNSQKNVIR